MDKKTKALIGIGVAHAVGCEICFNYHKTIAIKNQATEGEIEESIEIAEEINITFGGLKESNG